MYFGVLGPVLAATDDGTDVALGGPKQRSVLALLLTKAGRVVDTDVIVEELYPELGEGASRKTVQVYVSRLRSGLAEYGAGDIIQPRPNGYQIDTDGHTLDAQRFEDMLRDGRSRIASDPDEASHLLQTALGLWRGRPFEDAHPTPELDLEASRLEEQQLVAREAWAEAELAAGRHREVVADLQRLAEDHPLRESIWALLMLVLYRSGRQAEALRAYSELKHHLGEELGIAPSRELIDLEEKMLLQDASLDAPARPEVGPLPIRRPSSVWLAIAGAVVLAVIAIAGLAILWPTDDARIEPRVVARYPVSAGTTEIVAAGDRVWLLDPNEPVLTALDPQTGETRRYDLGVPPSAADAGLGHLWVASESEGSLLRIDPTLGSTSIIATDLELHGAALAVGDDAVWVIREHLRPFLRVDPDTLEMKTLDFIDGAGGPVAPDITMNDGALWGSNAFIGRIMTLDPPETGTPEFAGDPRHGAHPARSILANRGAIWFSQPTNGSLTRVDAESGAVTAITEIGRTGSPGLGLLVPAYGLSNGPGGVWAALPLDGKVALLDDDAAETIGEMAFGRPRSVTATVGRIWVLDEGAAELVEVDAGVCDPLPFITARADLRGCDLSGSVLVGVDLTGADLRWADLTRSAIQAADLTGVDLYGADLSSTAVDDVTWSGTRCPDGTLSDRNGGTCVGHLQP